jgi:hypothetical protein
VTGFKTVFANRAMTVGIEGLDKAESDAILNHIHEYVPDPSKFPPGFHD